MKLADDSPEIRNFHSIIQAFADSKTTALFMAKEIAPQLHDYDGLSPVPGEFTKIDLELLKAITTSVSSKPVVNGYFTFAFGSANKDYDAVLTGQIHELDGTWTCTIMLAQKLERVTYDSVTNN